MTDLVASCRNAIIAGWHQVPDAVYDGTRGLALNIKDAVAFVSNLEQNLGPESAHRRSLEGLIAELMEETFRSNDPSEKALLASVEMRARLILERWKKSEVN